MLECKRSAEFAENAWGIFWRLLANFCMAIYSLIDVIKCYEWKSIFFFYLNLLLLRSFLLLNLLLLSCSSQFLFYPFSIACYLATNHVAGNWRTLGSYQSSDGPLQNPNYLTTLLISTKECTQIGPLCPKNRNRLVTPLNLFNQTI